MHKEHKSDYIKIVVSLMIFVSVFFLPKYEGGEIFQTILYLIAYLIIGFEIIKKAFCNILKGEFFDENFFNDVSYYCSFCN